MNVLSKRAWAGAAALASYDSVGVDINCGPAPLVAIEPPGPTPAAHPTRERQGESRVHRHHSIQRHV